MCLLYNLYILDNLCFNIKINMQSVEGLKYVIFTEISMWQMLFIAVKLKHFDDNRVTQFLWTHRRLGVQGKLLENSWITYQMQFHLSL